MASNMAMLMLRHDDVYSGLLEPPLLGKTNQQRPKWHKRRTPWRRKSHKKDTSWGHSRVHSPMSSDAQELQTFCLTADSCAGLPCEHWLCLPVPAAWKIGWWAPSLEHKPCLTRFPARQLTICQWFPLGPYRCLLEVRINGVVLTWVFEWSLRDIAVASVASTLSLPWVISQFHHRDISQVQDITNSP
jgi:hypothetical protein